MTVAGWLFIAFFALMAFVGLLAAVRAGEREDEARAMLRERLQADHDWHVTVVEREEHRAGGAA